MNFGEQGPTIKTPQESLIEDISRSDNGSIEYALYTNLYKNNEILENLGHEDLLKLKEIITKRITDHLVSGSDFAGKELDYLQDLGSYHRKNIEELSAKDQASLTETEALP